MGWRIITRSRCRRIWAPRRLGSQAKGTEKSRQGLQCPGAGQRHAVPRGAVRGAPPQRRVRHLQMCSFGGRVADAEGATAGATNLAVVTLACGVAGSAGADAKRARRAAVDRWAIATRRAGGRSGAEVPPAPAVTWPARIVPGRPWAAGATAANGTKTSETLKAGASTGATAPTRTSASRVLLSMPLGPAGARLSTKAGNAVTGAFCARLIAAGVGGGDRASSVGWHTAAHPAVSLKPWTDSAKSRTAAAEAASVLAAGAEAKDATVGVGRAGRARVASRRPHTTDSEASWVAMIVVGARGRPGSSASVPPAPDILRSAGYRSGGGHREAAASPAGPAAAVAGAVLRRPCVASAAARTAWRECRVLQLAGAKSRTYAPDGTCTRLSVFRIAGYGTAVLPSVAPPIRAWGYYFVSLFRLFPS